VQTIEVPVFGGLGGVGLLDELLAGSAGAMTGFAFPEALVATVTAWEHAGYTQARDAFVPWMPLVLFEAQEKVSLALRKEILRRRGLIAESAVRPPGLAMPASLIPALEAHLGTVEPLGERSLVSVARTIDG
jgi:4-hydroxy-tetrahydrodipicolinate synthase